MRIFILSILFATYLFSFEYNQLIIKTDIFNNIEKLSKLQNKQLDKNSTQSDDEVHDILDKNEQLLENILLSIRTNPYSTNFINQDKFQKRIYFLNNRMELNKKRGNGYAVKRDKIEKGYLKELEHINNYVVSLSSMIQSYSKQSEIKTFSLQMLKEHKTTQKEHFTKIYKSLLNSNDRLANSIKKNYKIYISFFETYDKLLEYTVENSKLLSQKTIFTLINYADIIKSINASPSATWLNNKIAFLYLNSGKLVLMFLILFLLGTTLFLSRSVLRFRFLNFKHYENRKLLRPIRLLVGVVALDYFILTLMYPLQPNSLSNSIIIFAYVVALTYLAMEFVSYIIIGYFETKSSSENEKALLSLSIDIIKTFLVVSAFVIYLNKMGVGLQAVLTSLGIFGLGIALAAKDSIANFFGSLNILLDNSFSQGDFISIGEFEGEVVKVGLRSTQIRALNNSLILIPNAETAIKPIVNWSKRRLGREIKTTISISYTTDLEKIKNIIYDIRQMISQHPDLVQNNDIIKYENETNSELFIPKKHLFGLKKDRYVYLENFESSHMSILVQTFSRALDTETWYKVKESLLYSILEILKKYNVEFAVPEQKIFLKEEDKN